MAYRNKEDQRRASQDHYWRDPEARKRAAKKKREEYRVTCRLILKRWKMDRDCVVCGFSDWRAFQAHHRPEFEKVGNVADLVRDGWSVKKVQRELAKCEAWCANCHQIHHHIQRESGGENPWSRPQGGDGAAEDSQLAFGFDAPDDLERERR